MALAAIGGAALGAAFGELLKLLKVVVKQTAAFDPELKSLETTLKQIEPVFTDIRVEQRTITTLGPLLEDAKKLLDKCSKIKPSDLIKKIKYANKLKDLDNKLFKFYNIEALDAVLSGNKVILGRGRFFGPCSAPGLSQFTVGLDQHLREVKRTLLKDDTQLLVVSAPGGFGKTTLAKKLCHDDQIKGIFGDNILYVTLSIETSLTSIAQTLFKHYDINNYEFKSEEDAKNQIENLIRRKGSGKMLLVLDNVWSESVIWDLKFEIPGYKILVTSRDSFPESNFTYNLSLLTAKDAKILFRHYAFASDQIPVPDDLINKMVEFCKGIPLALKAVGASLRGRPEVVWRTTLEKWSEGQSILESHKQLLLCLQTSINALDELQKNCFLDFGLFPEDDQIAGSTLMDMWLELYKLDKKGKDAGTNLFNLSSRNLIDLVPIREVTGEMGGHCSQYRVTQHDVLRELAIHLSRQEPAAERTRLFIEIHSNNFPEWWTQQSVIARILSISTDGESGSAWDDLNAPNVEVLILNIWSENYTLPHFIEKMTQLKVLIVTGYGSYPAQLHNLQVLASLSKLRRTRFEHVSVSPSIQVIFTLKTLTKLTFVMCKIGNALSSHTIRCPYMLENLEDFEIDLCYDLKELPAGLCSSVRLQTLIITNCQELDDLPKELGNLSSLEILGLHCCTKLKELPDSIGRLCKLRSMDISDCSHITALPKQIGKLCSLKVIDISGCVGLKKLPKSLAELKQLQVVTCDEERSYLWKNIERDFCNVKLHLVEEDRVGTLQKICQ